MHAPYFDFSSQIAKNIGTYMQERKKTWFLGKITGKLLNFVKKVQKNKKVDFRGRGFTNMLI
jgi:hypothetical protein